MAWPAHSETNPDWTEDQEWQVFNKTGGICFYCADKILWEEYRLHGYRVGGAWQIDHYVPRVLCKAFKVKNCNGFANLFPACWRCNNRKRGRLGSTYTRQRWNAGKGVFIPALDLATIRHDHLPALPAGQRIAPNR